MSVAATLEPQVARRASAQGTELRVVLASAADTDDMRAALALGFSSALAFDAGLGCDEQGRWLLLTRWVDAAEGATAVDDAHAALLDQWAAWRALLPGGLQSDLPTDLPPDPRPRPLASQEQKQQRLLGLLGRTTL